MTHEEIALQLLFEIKFTLYAPQHLERTGRKVNLVEWREIRALALQLTDECDKAIASAIENGEKGK